MGSSVNGLGVLSVVALLALGAWAVTPATGAEPVMCEPVTIEDLLADEPEEEENVDPTTTTNPPATTSPPTTTTSPPTTTTSPTTTSPSTTSPSTTSPSTTSPSTTEPSDPTTTEPETTTTTAGPSTTTTSPSTTATTSSSPTTTATSTTDLTSTTTSPTSTTEPTTTTTEPPCDTPFVYPMVFPFSGAGTIGSPFGAPRDGGERHHLGNDIAAPILQPVVAVADGTVSVIAGDTGISGYRVHIRHDDGWSSLYIHLNNDTAGTDDGNGIGTHPALAEGDRVEAGDVIGWNGDSGNAESTEPHLHFELRDPSGTSVDPRASLEAAAQSEDRFGGPFSDLAVEEYETDAMVLLLTRGMAAWCGNGTTACPDKPATGGDLAVWLDSLLDAPVVECDPECTGVTEADLARALAWARLADAEVAVDDIPDGRVTAPPPAPPDSPADLEVREAHRLLGGPDRCLSLPNDERELTRRQAAETLVLYLGWTESPYCPTSSTNR